MGLLQHPSSSFKVFFDLSHTYQTNWFRVIKHLKWNVRFRPYEWYSTLIFRNSGNKDTNYMLAILDSRMKIVAHERFQYVLLKKFGETKIVLMQTITPSIT